MKRKTYTLDEAIEWMAQGHRARPLHPDWQNHSWVKWVNEDSYIDEDNILWSLTELGEFNGWILFGKARIDREARIAELEKELAATERAADEQRTRAKRAEDSLLEWDTKLTAIRLALTAAGVPEHESYTDKSAEAYEAALRAGGRMLTQTERVELLANERTEQRSRGDIWFEIVADRAKEIEELKNRLAAAEAEVERARHARHSGQPTAEGSAFLAMRDRMAEGRAKYPAGCTPTSLSDEAGEFIHAVNKRESDERCRDELLDVMAVAMRLYLGEIDREWQPSFGAPAVDSCAKGSVLPWFKVGDRLARRSPSNCRALAGVGSGVRGQGTREPRRHAGVR